MTIRAELAVLVAMLAAAGTPRLAHADIYTWVDASGTVNVSNVAPPDGARVTGVVHANPEAVDAARDAARAAQVQALGERVRQLEQDLERARNQPPIAMPYPPIAPPAAPAYPASVAPAYVSYPVEQPAAPAYAYGCDPSWAGCGAWWGVPFYAAPIVVVNGAHGRHFRGSGHGHRLHGSGHGHQGLHGSGDGHQGLHGHRAGTHRPMRAHGHGRTR